MPYIQADRRAEITAGSPPKNGGELNYLFTSLILTGKPLKSVPFEQICTDFWNLSEQRYAVINEIGGAAFNCALEFKRRGFHNTHRAGLLALGEGYIDFYRIFAGPYENAKIQENGDVFPA
jgi:hypothetical protein